MGPVLEPIGHPMEFAFYSYAGNSLKRLELGNDMRYVT